MRYARDHKARTRTRVLDEAAAAIRAEGFDRLSVASLMSRAGLTHGAFYAHWRSKEALLADAVDHMFADAANAYFADAETQEPRCLLRRYVEGYLSMAHVDGRERGCPVPILAGEQHRLPAQARERFRTAANCMTGRVTNLLRQSGVDDADMRSASAVAEMVGAVAIARVAASRTAAQALLAAARTSVLAKLGFAVRATDRP